MMTVKDIINATSQIEGVLGVEYNITSINDTADIDTQMPILLILDQGVRF